MAIDKRTDLNHTSALLLKAAALMVIIAVVLPQN
jgi:hypothetical protein